MIADVYDDKFFAEISLGSSSSARTLVPYLMEVFKPTTVIDVGCGEGIWAAEFLKCGASQVLGVDGGAGGTDSLRIQADSFLSADLEAPLRMNRRFDMAISVEVAEHLSPTRAASFIDDLTRLAPVVVFSAAIPFQDGTHHINEQWPSYWRSLFASHNYHAIDCIRPRFWSDTTVDLWYRQNMVVYLSQEYAQTLTVPLPTMSPDVVHPELFQYVLKNLSVRFIFKSLPGALERAISRRLPRMKSQVPSETLTHVLQ